jgi:hypothetical protein
MPSEREGSAVYDLSGEPLGAIDHIRLDRSSGRHYAVLRFNRNLPTSGASTTIAACTHGPHEHKPVDRLGYECCRFNHRQLLQGSDRRRLASPDQRHFCCDRYSNSPTPVSRTSCVPREALGKALGAQGHGRSRDHDLDRRASARSYPCAQRGPRMGDSGRIEGEVHPLSGGTLKLRSVAGAGRGARNTGRSRLALPSRYAGLLHGSVAWVRVGS